MALVLAIEPDLRQAEILKRIVRERVKADVVIVDSRDAAMEAMRSKIPDVMLVSALLSPRDEDELVAHLRTLDNAEHLQTHTIPQLASAGGKGHSGAGGGLLKAFRRKKNAEPAVAGCDPEHFADEIRVFLEQAEQKRFERAEELKYRPAVKPIAAAPQPKVEDAAGPAAAAMTTSWDSPFEWRRSDELPMPPRAFEEQPTAVTFRPNAPADADSAFDLPIEAFSVEPAAEAPPAEAEAPSEPPFEAAPPLETAPEYQPEPSLNLQALPPFEPESTPPIDAQPAPSVEIEAAPILDILALPPYEPEPAPVVEMNAAPAMTPEFLPAIEAQTAPSAEPVAEVPPTPVYEPAETFQSLDVPELFETFVEPAALAAAPIPELITFDSVAEASIEHVTFDLAPIEEHDDPVETPSPVIATPEEIESYGRPAPAAPAGDEPAFAIIPDIEWLADSQTDGGDAALEWQAAPAQAPAAESVDIDLESLAVSVESAEDEAELDARAPRKVPPSLGPLATWARLERKNGDERKPGSDMREIIERLAVPPHIAGVSYARGVRIRRVRVAGTPDRRRPADHSGPVILSRRALAATRSSGPGATA